MSNFTNTELEWLEAATLMLKTFSDIIESFCVLAEIMETLDYHEEGDYEPL
jgi:hypothetical protein